MRIYVAAPLGDVLLARHVAHQLTMRGHQVVSSWHAKVAPGQTDPLTHDERANVASECLQELADADWVVAVLNGTAQPRGTLFELGYAHGRKKGIVALLARGAQGPCVFASLPTVVRVELEGDLYATVACAPPPASSSRIPVAR